MNFENWYSSEINTIREKIKTFDARQIQMVILCSGGFAAIIGFSEKIPEIIIPIILFIWMLITENIHYVSIESRHFLTEYIIQYSRKHNKYDIFEDAYKRAYYLYDSNANRKNWKLGIRNFIKFFYYPFIILPLGYLIYSTVIIIKIYPEISELFLCGYSLFIISSIVILLGYFYILIRNIMLRRKTINKKIFIEFQSRINDIISQNKTNAGPNIYLS